MRARLRSAKEPSPASTPTSTVLAAHPQKGSPPGSGVRWEASTVSVPARPPDQRSRQSV